MKKQNLWRQIGAMLVIITMMFGMVACGEKNESKGETDSSSQVSDTKETSEKTEKPVQKEIEYAQGVDDSHIKVGTIGVQSGPLSFIGVPYFAGMESYFKMINDNGGVNGRQIELVKKDDEFNVEKAVAGMESLIYDEEVFSIVGHLGTPGVLATIDMVKEEGIPSVYFGSGVQSLTTAGENFFPVQPNYVYEGKLMAKFAKEYFNASKIAVIYRNDDVGRDGLKGIQEGLEELGQKEMLSEDAIMSFNAGDSDFTVQVQKAKAEDPEIVIVYGLAGGTAGVLKEMEKVGYSVPVLTTYSNADMSFLAVAAPGAPNMIENVNVMGWLDVTDESLKPLMDAMKKYYPEAPVNAYTMAGWVAAETFVAGLKETGDNLNWEGFVDGMNHLSFKDGLAPEITYSEGVREGVQKMAVSRVQKNGESFEFHIMSDFLSFED